MDYILQRIADAAPGSGLLQVHVHDDGQGVAGVNLQLYNGPWISQWEHPNVGTTGTKDTERPGLVELIHVDPGNRLLGVEIQPGQWAYLLLELPDHAFWALDINLTAPRLEYPSRDESEGPPDA